MPQLKEDEWPNDDEPTTEEEQLKDDRNAAARQDTSPAYPPQLPPSVLPTKGLIDPRCRLSESICRRLHIRRGTHLSQ